MRKSVVLSSSPDCMENFTDIGIFEWTFSVSVDSVFKASGHIDFHHRGVYNTSDDPVMVSMRLLSNGNQIPGAKTGANIVGVKQHYVVLPVHAYIELSPGTYTIRLQTRAASTAAPGKHGLAEVKGGYNHVVYEVVPV